MSHVWPLLTNQGGRRAGTGGQFFGGDGSSRPLINDVTRMTVGDSQWPNTEGKLISPARIFIPPGRA